MSSFHIYLSDIYEMCCERVTSPFNKTSKYYKSIILSYNIITSNNHMWLWAWPTIQKVMKGNVWGFNILLASFPQYSVRNIFNVFFHSCQLYIFFLSSLNIYKKLRKASWKKYTFYCIYFQNFLKTTFKLNLKLRLISTCSSCVQVYTRQ